jgi:hypothetical protein
MSADRQCHQNSARDGNFEVAEEVVDAWGCDVHAFIVIFGAFCGDEAVRLVVSAT